MDAKSVTQFLAILIADSRYPMDAVDLEKAIEIAGAKSPSGAFDAAQRYYIMRHGSAVMNGYLAFAKGTRWLAIIRRDEGQKAFEAVIEQLRQAVWR